MLTLAGLAKSYGGGARRQVLQGLDFELRAGEYIAIMGESGVGKSTLLNLIAGLDTPDAGTVTLNGAPFSELDERARTLQRRRDIGFIFQAFHLLPRLTVAQNIALPLYLLDVPRAEAEDRVADMLDRLGLAGRGADLPRTLSSGQVQRVAIGRALIHRPRLLLADEPTGNLDPDTAARVLDLLAQAIAESGAAAILVTHSHAAAATAGRVCTLTAAGLQPGVADPDAEARALVRAHAGARPDRG